MGHDHINDFVGTYCGIKLGYDANIGFATYGLEGEERDRLRGARVFRIREQNPQTIETWMRYACEFEKECSLEKESSFLVIAHRGASGYFPEHTLEAYAMAYAMGADYIEPDLVLTKDRILICLHDIYLEPTTNVEEMYPERRRSDGHWYAADFTLEEIKKLRVHERSKADGTAYFPDRFPVEFQQFEVPTFEEVIRLIQGLNKSTGRQVGIYPELKQPGWHKKEQFEGVEAILLDTLQKYGYTEKDAGVFIQCFDPESLKIMRFELGTRLPLVQLVGSGEEYAQMLTEEGLKEIASYADGIGIWKGHIEKNPKLVEQIRNKGLFIHAWTFRKDNVPENYQNLKKSFIALFLSII
ncbi:glycerophosphodiester phosphodiesterase [Atrimonas thermophila]|uniref:glycerophosphodiester phosphodiesterase n=1 Tax=Atrimonas thermophila TaxID=3064161 RepID=UPI00399D412D